MEHDKNNLIPDDSTTNRGDLEPGRADRNLLSDTHSEAPIDKDQPLQKSASEAGDETYEDEELNDRDYFEKRAGDNVRK